MDLLNTYRNHLSKEVRREGNWLYWTRSKETVIINRKIFENIVKHTTWNPDYIEAVIQEYGPLWEGDKIFLKKAYSMIRAYELISLLHDGATEPGVPSRSEELEKKFFEPLSKWEETWVAATGGNDVLIGPGFFDNPRSYLQEAMKKAIKQPNHGSQNKRSPRLWMMVNGEGNTEFLPVTKSPDFWPTFQTPPIFKTWEEKKYWLNNQLMDNVVSLLKANLDVSIKKKGGKVRIAEKPSNCYAWGLAKLITQDVYRCPVCKKTTGSRFCSRKCKQKYLTSSDKQSVLDYFRPQVGRGKLSTEEYDFVKKRVSEVFAKNNAISAKVIHWLAVRAISSKWPDREYSFLKTFGSRKNKKSPS